MVIDRAKFKKFSLDEAEEGVEKIMGDGCRNFKINIMNRRRLLKNSLDTIRRGRINILIILLEIMK